MGAAWCRNENLVKLSFNTVVRLSVIAMVAGRLGSVFCNQFSLRSIGVGKWAPVILIWASSWTFMTMLHKIWVTWDLHDIQWKDWTETLCDVQDLTGDSFWVTYMVLMLYLPLLMLLLLYTTAWSLTRKYTRVLREANVQSRSQQLMPGILLLCVLVAICSEIPSQTYIILKYIANPGRGVSIEYPCL